LIGRRPLRNPRADEDGSTVVEAAILVPIAMLVVLLAVQACLWAHAATLVQNAAAEGDQAATVMGGSTSAGVSQADTFLRSTSSGVVVDPVIETTLLPGDVVRMDVTGIAESIIPGVHLPVSAVRIGVVQEFRQSG
jgi:TadE-like protein